MRVFKCLCVVPFTYVHFMIIRRMFIGLIQIYLISSPIYSGIPRNIDHGRHGPSMQYFLLHSQIHINHFDSIYPFRSLESLVTSLDVIYITFELSIKNLSTADTTKESIYR
jgi:hypothetical protein